MMGNNIKYTIPFLSQKVLLRGVKLSLFIFFLLWSIFLNLRLDIESGKITSAQAIAIVIGKQWTNSIGIENFRISQMGFDGDSNFDAFDASVAYNSVENEFMVVWSGDDGTAPLVDNETEIYGQRINGINGALIGNKFRISEMGPDGDVNFGTARPAIAYDTSNNRYLVVWRGDDDTLVDNEFEIFGQLVSADGSQIIPDDFRISDMGPAGDTGFSAQFPKVVFDSYNGQYLVVWEGDDNENGHVDNEYEIFGQLLNENGGEIGANDFSISEMGGVGNANYAAYTPGVVFNSINREFLIIWRGDDNTGNRVDEEFEIYGQRLTDDGIQIGVDDFRISDMGPNSDAEYDAYCPSVTYNSLNNTYLVVWQGDNHENGLVNDEYEIYGQFIREDGMELNVDFQISEMGGTGNPIFDAFCPSVEYTPSTHKYLVVWEGDGNTDNLVDEEFEIFGQELDENGLQIGLDFRISFMGPDSNILFGGYRPAVAYNTTEDRFLIAWDGDVNATPLVEDEFEIYGQYIVFPTNTPNPIITSSISPTPTYTSTPKPAFLPLVIRCPNFLRKLEHEDNDNFDQANMLDCSYTYEAFPDDPFDFFEFRTTTFESPPKKQIVVELLNHVGNGVQMVVFDMNGNPACEECRRWEPPYRIEFMTPKNTTYYIMVYTESGFSTSTPYTLMINFP